MGLLLTSNQTPVTMVKEGQIDIGGAVHGSGCGIKLNGNAIQLKKKGYFVFHAVIDANITDAAEATVSLAENGNTVYSQSATPSAAGGSALYDIVWVFRNGCCCEDKSITLTINAGATINSVNTVTEEYYG